MYIINSNPFLFKTEREKNRFSCSILVPRCGYVAPIFRHTSSPGTKPHPTIYPVSYFV